MRPVYAILDADSKFSPECDILCHNEQGSWPFYPNSLSIIIMGWTRCFLCLLRQFDFVQIKKICSNKEDRVTLFQKNDNLELNT